ncbi:outer membrane protein assembly factor BamA [Candidatus Endomicrobiellum devescovinae]|uniref:outer membrane protein assembly factor BamA n=1 Tax=Candidatus Endomicrobiellum devescovinae TaxID=3242322 RepID=UPI002820BC33|nr:outer membrane protein assembly factor BamA [Endomicrobium sp.]
MKLRLFLTGLCVCMLMSVFAYADNIISKVNIKGLRNVKEKTVLSEIKLKKGKEYSLESARAAVRSITELGYFDECTFTFDRNTGVLTFDVVEKPYLESIVFKGNVEFSNSKLKGTSVLKEKDFYDILKLEESKKKILKLYGDKGYADCVIEAYPTIDIDTNRMTVTFLITENNKILIGDVKIEGVISYPNKKILKLIKKIRPKKIFKDENYQKDLLGIETFYKNNGFMDYKLVTSTVSFNNSRTEMFLTLNISEGVKYKIGEIAFDGNSVLEDKELKKTVKFKKGQAFNEQKVAETKQEIAESYADKGYLQAQIVPDFHKIGDIVNIDWNIKENSIVYVGNIYIEGLESTKEKVIRRELLLKPEHVFSRKKLIGSVQRIRNLGFIDGVEPHLLPTGAPNIVDLALEITEGKPGNINAGVGYSSVDEVVFTVGLMHMNLFGLGQHLDFSVEYGKKKTNFNISWTEPYIFNKNMSLTLSAFDMLRKKDFADVTNAYDEHRTGFSIDLGPRISPLVSLMFGYRYENVMLSKIDDSVKQKIEESSDLSQDRTTSVFVQIVYDSLDYRYDPTRGNRQSLGVNLAGSYLGGEVDYVRTVFKSSWFLPVVWKFVLSARLELGSVVSYGHSKTVPLYERFYIGGPESVRGYKYRTEIGPDDGGNYKAVLNFEYKFPVVAERGNSILVGAFFYDIGGDWGRCGTVKWLGTGENNLRSSAGFELRLATPAFPIRIGWAYGFNHKEKESLQDLYFSIGFPM